MDDDYSDEAACAAHAWFSADRAPHDPATTGWRRRARWRQARWRLERGFPVGAEPYRGGDDSMPVGSRVELAFARETGCNFMVPGALEAVRARLAAPEAFQLLSEDRLWADLLSSMPLCFNLFGSLAGQPQAARSAVDAWWPGAPAGEVTLRFEHSPGRRDPEFLGNQSAFDVAFEIAMGEHRGILGVETKYHEFAREEPAPRASAMERYTEITERSCLFKDGWSARLVGTELQQLWLDHLLVLAMLQHPSGRWRWGRFVLVAPAGNPSLASAAARYRDALADPSSFIFMTLEQLLDCPGALAEDVRAQLRARYL